MFHDVIVALTFKNKFSLVTRSIYEQMKVSLYIFYVMLNKEYSKKR